MDKEEVKKVIISETSGAVKTKGTVRRNSTGISDTRTSASLLSSNEKLPPYHLSASTSSCHDFCKYGRKHVFVAKKRKPNLRRLFGSSEISDEKQKAELSTLRERRKKPEQNVKTASQPKGGLLAKSEGIEQNDLKEIQILDTHAFEENKSFEVSGYKNLHTQFPSQGCIASLEHSPASDGEESSEEHVSIKTETPSAAHRKDELSDASETTKIDSSSPTEKRVISHELITPLPWSEESSDGSEVLEVEMPSPIDTSKNQVEGSSEEPLEVEIITSLPVSENMKHADEPIRSKVTIPSMQKILKAKILPPTRRSIASNVRSSTIEEKSSEKALGMKLKTPPNHKSISAAVEQNLTNKLKMVEGKRREKSSSQLKSVSDRAKTTTEKRFELTGQPIDTKWRAPSPVGNTIAKSSKPKIVQQKNLSSVRKLIVPVSPRITKQKAAEQKTPSSIKKFVVSMSPYVTKQKASPTIKRIDEPAQPSISSKPSRPVVKSTPMLMSMRRLSAQKNSENKIVKSADLSKLREEPVLKSSRASISTKSSVGRETESLKSMKPKSSKTSSPANNQAKFSKRKHTNEKVKEKTLYVVEPKTLKTDPKPNKKELKKNRAKFSLHASSSSSSSLLSASVSSHETEENEESTLSEASEVVLDKEKTKKCRPVQSPKRQEKRWPSRTAAVRPEAKPPSPHKLKFQRGKIVNPEPENNVPRKLRFRQAKGPSEKQNTKESGRRIFRRRRVSCGSAAELITPTIEAAAVVLRHQDVQEKKDTQGLFNHVIEETASKLVETKKSKVKALVGAFETVISLQESRVVPTV